MAMNLDNEDDRKDLEQFVHDSYPLQSVWAAIGYLAERIAKVEPHQFLIPCPSVNCVITDLKFVRATGTKGQW